MAGQVHRRVFFIFFAGCADKIHGETLPIDKPDLFVFTKREPIGVVAAVVPWNSQLFLSAVKIGPALAAGNTIVVKASEHASAAMLAFGELVEQAGIPPGVVNIVTGHGDPCGRVLTSHPLVSRISFTGGPVAARHVLAKCDEQLCRGVFGVVGGNHPSSYSTTRTWTRRVNGAVSAIFGASGQSCVAGSRLYLQEDIADAFLEAMVEKARSIKLGDPVLDETEMGPLCTRGQLENIEHQVALAQEEGGQVICGGSRPMDLPGLFYEPTIITCPRQDMKIVDSELFGPVLAVLRFKDEAEAVRLANESEHGLAAGIFTQNSARSLRVSDRIRAGIVWVNTYRAVSPIAEFGGVKGSGYGRESGFQAIYDYTRPKTVWMNTSDEPLPSQFVAR